MIDLTAQQLANAQASETRPLYLIEHFFGGAQERASTGGEVQYGNAIYAAGGVNLISIRDSQTATFRIHATPERKALLDSGTWRRQACVIHYVPALPLDFELSYAESDGFVIIDGELSNAVYDGAEFIEVSVRQSTNNTKVTPRYTWDAVSVHCPPAGTELVWQGDRYVLQPREQLKSLDVFSRSLNVAGIRARQARDFSQTQATLSLTATGEGSPIKLILGDPSVAGDIIAIGSHNPSGDLVVAIGWGYGEVEEITKVFINNEEIIAGGVEGTDITFTNYVGKFNQKPDPLLQNAIPAFVSDFTLTTPEGVIGTAYTVFRIPAGVLTTSPTFNALVEGVGVFDPRTTGENSPTYNENVVSMSFSTGAPVDYVVTPLPYTLEGDATIGKTELVLNGGGYLHFPYDASMPIVGSDDYAMLIRFSVDSLAATQWIAGSETNAALTNRGWALQITTAGDLLLYKSTNGTAWDVGMPQTVATGVEVGDSLVCAWVRDLGGIAGFVVNGENGAFYVDLNGVFNDGSSGIVLGARADSTDSSDHFTGRVNYFRYTPDAYDENLGAGNMISGLPFPEFEKYSNTSALCAGQVVRHPVYGLGREVNGLTECANFNEELIDGLFTRCSLSLALSTPQNTLSLLDLLFSEYSECFWFNDGRDIKAVPNSIANGSVAYGVEQLVSNHDFSNGATDWVVTDPQGAITFSGGKLIIDGTNTDLTAISQSVTGEPNTRYASRTQIDSISGGGYTILFITPSVVTTEGLNFVTTTTGGTGDATVLIVFEPNTTLTMDFTELQRLFWREDNIVRGSFTIEPVEDEAAPNQVATRFTDRQTDSPNWPTILGDSIPRVGVSDGSLPLVNTTVYLDGVTSVVEANNKSNNKVARYENQVFYSYITTDTGIRHRKGDLVELPIEGNHGFRPVGRVLEAEMIAYARHAVRAMKYLDSQYPSEVILPDEDGVVPVGAIVLQNGAVTPDGWARFTLADGRHIVGAGDTYSPGDTGGAATFGGFAGQTSSNNAHGNVAGGTGDDEGLQTTGDYALDIDEPQPGGANNAFEYDIGITDSTLHFHTYNTGVFDPELFTRNQRLMIKTGTSSTTFPKEARVFALPNIVAAGVQRITTEANRLLRSNNSESNTGVEDKIIPIAMSAIDIDHGHIERRDAVTPNMTPSVPAGEDIQTYSHQEDFDLHAHDDYGVRNFLVERNVKRMPAALFGADDSFAMVPGMYIMWSGSLASIPADFVLADGSNQTYDFRDFFIEIAAVGNEGQGSGDNTFSLDGRTAQYRHRHREFLGPIETTVKYRAPHINDQIHRHDVQQTENFTPEYYALAVLMYAPA